MIIDWIYISFFLLVVIFHLSGHSEIGHFDDSMIGQKDIAGRQIAVQNLFMRDVRNKWLLAFLN